MKPRKHVFMKQFDNICWSKVLRIFCRNILAEIIIQKCLNEYSNLGKEQIINE
jgi:hypothetical protein